jgi:GNAT superfamily N-acetyltransferase
MITIREYTEQDAESVGKVIADTYSKFNLSYLPPEELNLFLGPFQHANSLEKSNQEAIANMIWSEWVFVAEDEGKIVGVLRGRKERLGSLFVKGNHHRQGIGRGLVERFEQECQKHAPMIIRVAATVYGVPFYTAMGYKRSTGMRASRSFEGHGLPIQPMRKVLERRVEHKPVIRNG